jgi:hypothetical protein
MFLLQLIISIMLFLYLWISIYFPQFFLITYLSHYVLVIHVPHSILSYKGKPSFPYISPLILQRATWFFRAINCWGLDEEAVNRNSATVDRADGQETGYSDNKTNSGCVPTQCGRVVCELSISESGLGHPCLFPTSFKRAERL